MLPVILPPLVFTSRKLFGALEASTAAIAEAGYRSFTSSRSGSGEPRGDGFGGAISHRIHGAAIYGNIYHQYTPNVSIYTIHGSYGYTNKKTDLNVAPF